MAELTPAQVQMLRTDITVTRANVVFEGLTLLELWVGSSHGQLADFYNHEAAPVVLLWRPRVSTQELIDSALGTEYIAGTAGADVARRAWFDKVTSAEFVDATRAQVRANFSTAAGAASTTLTNWTAVARSNATYGEALYITSTVAGASITAQYGYRMTPDDIIRAQGL